MPMRLLLSSLLIMALCGCSSFNKLQKHGTDAEKYKAALDYYQKKDWNKAGLLFEELAPVLKGSNEAELAQFYYAYTQYYQHQYLLSSTLFKKFYETFARSDRAEEAMYMYAKSLFKDTPDFNLDQSNTLTATSALQDFINIYPQSAYRDESTLMLQQLRQKLERKAYEKARQYYKISGFTIAAYKSAVVSINNFQRDFPDSQYNEELSFLKIDAEYSLATHSTFDKQKERFQETLTYYNEFIDKYPNSKYLKEAEKMYASSQQELERIGKMEAEFEKEKAKQANKPGQVTASN